MSKKRVKIRKYRRYSEDFKREIVKAFETGQYSVLELSKLHGIAYGLVYKWIYKYAPSNERGYRIVEMSDSTDTKVKYLQNKIEELERLLGRKQIQVDYLEQLIEQANQAYDLDIKKNSNTSRLGGSKRTDQK